MRNLEEDRKAYYKDIAATEKKKAIEIWLQANPEIGTLNGGTFYKFVDSKQVAVTPPLNATGGTAL